MGPAPGELQPRLLKGRGLFIDASNRKECSQSDELGCLRGLSPPLPQSCLHFVSSLVAVDGAKAQLAATNCALAPRADPGKPSAAKDAESLGHVSPMKDAQCIGLVL